MREKQEKALLIEELSINVYTRKGIIFSARRTTDSTLLLSPILIFLFRPSFHWENLEGFCPRFSCAAVVDRP